MTDQISIYTENKKGAAREILSTLSREGINILGIVSHDSAEFGTMRLIVSEPEKAFSLLCEKGYLCRMGAVLAIELEDKPGELENMLAAVGDMNLNIDYLYVGYSRERCTPVIHLRCSDMELVAAMLERKGYRVS